MGVPITSSDKNILTSMGGGKPVLRELGAPPSSLAAHPFDFVMQPDVPSHSFLQLGCLVFSYLGPKSTLRYILKNLCFMDHYYILRLNLAKLGLPNKIRFHYTIRRAEERDLEDLIDATKTLGAEERKEILCRFLFYRAGFKNCYIVRDKMGEPAYLQWLIYPNENSIIMKKFRHRFYRLTESQVQIENAFTFPRFRGLGLLPAISAELLNSSRNEGYKYAVAYIKKANTVSLNAFMKLNFSIRKMVREYKILGRTIRML